eukprot:TRINITY_DN17284_c0_g1_i2.p1 TRINITY_DN17284_c0_g1~~TRINITY_DN17284_c0_g1_i2.p1  ORF type:complete len:413 (-),score=84.07 TRINITY_DN17284_c0_g1_i2:27-1265(-)
MNITTPAAFPKNFKKEKTDWDYETEEQKQLNNRKLYLPRGKGWGGSSSINAMIYMRGNREDFNEWAKQGCKGWSYDEVLPFFQKAENQTGNIPDKSFHGFDGPLNVEDRNTTNFLSKVFVEAAKEVGFQENHDFNGLSQMGFGMFQSTTKNGSRCSASVGYLKPSLKRSNLKVLSEVLVSRILVENQIAKGVEFFDAEGKIQTVNSDREILLCAGSYNSPKILMLSGIGEEKQLKQHGIQTIKNLPGVGKNLQDHIQTPTIFNCNYKKTLDSAENFPNILFNLFKYLFFKTGPFSSNVGEAGGFLSSEASEKLPDIQVHFAPCFFAQHGFEKPAGNGFTVASNVANPKSRGILNLKSNNPRDSPIIDHNYFSHPDDLKIAVYGIKQCFKNGRAYAPKVCPHGLRNGLKGKGG